MIISRCHPRGWAHPQNRLTGIRHCAAPIPRRRQGRATSLEMVYEMATRDLFRFKQELPLLSIQPH
jgi:hypothetical protein